MCLRAHPGTCQLRDAASMSLGWEACDSWRPKHAATPRVCTMRSRCASPASPAAVQEWEEDAVGEGKDLLAQTNVLRTARVGLTPDPGSCWVPEARGKRDQRLGDVCVCAGGTGAGSPALPQDRGTADRDPCLPGASLAAPSWWR